ncbi:MAG: hypothetical protein R2848_18250 [Thermomicrobiales bacterium]
MPSAGSAAAISIAELGGHGIEGSPIGRRGRQGIRKERGRVVDAKRVAGIDGAAEGMVLAPKRHHLVATPDAESIERSRLAGKGMRLVHDPAGDESHVVLPYRQNARAAAT